MGLEDEYTSYCFNEACAYMMYRIENGEKPYFKENKGKQHYSRPSDLYKKYEKGGCQ